MSDKPLYLFLFSHVQSDVPYTNSTIHVYHPWPAIVTFGSCLLYVFLIFAVFPLYKSKFSSEQVNVIAKVHHALLFCYSLFSFLAILYHIIITNEIINWSNFLCDSIPPWLRIISLTFTMSKIWEWFDTAILIWKGHSWRKIGFLHIYHHATTFLLFVCVMDFPGTEKSGMLINGFVHTLMYYHFAFRLPKFLRPIITTLQIVQLITVIYMWCTVPSACPAYSSFPREHRLEFLLPGALVPVYCLFFLKFFIEQYVLSTSTKIESSSRKKQ